LSASREIHENTRGFRKSFVETIGTEESNREVHMDIRNVFEIDGPPVEFAGLGERAFVKAQLAHLPEAERNEALVGQSNQTGVAGLLCGLCGLQTPIELGRSGCEFLRGGMRRLSWRDVLGNGGSTPNKHRQKHSQQGDLTGRSKYEPGVSRGTEPRVGTTHKRAIRNDKEKYKARLEIFKPRLLGVLALGPN
jgi:hypothetical protein